MQLRRAPAAAPAEDSPPATATDAAAGRLAPAPATQPTLAALRQDIAERPARWSWRAGPDARQAVGPALLDWLTRLDAAAASRWTTAPAASAALSATDLDLLLDGRPAHRLRLDGATLRWETLRGPRPGRWQADLDAAEAEALREALGRALR